MSAASKRKILIVDDHPAYASVLAASLRSRGFEVIVTHEGEKAVSLAEAERPDLALLDIMMPKMGGTEVRAELMKRPATQAIPVIYLTGLRPPQYSKASNKASRGPVVPTVGKSEDLSELLQAIRQTLSNLNPPALK